MILNDPSIHTAGSMKRNFSALESRYCSSVSRKMKENTRKETLQGPNDPQSLAVRLTRRIALHSTENCHSNFRASSVERRQVKYE